jgi:hypothetical protein
MTTLAITPGIIIGVAGMFAFIVMAIYDYIFIRKLEETITITSNALVIATEELLGSGSAPKEVLQKLITFMDRGYQRALYFDEHPEEEDDVLDFIGDDL